MMRIALGLVALDACMLAAGWSLLRGLGLVRTAAQALRHTGTALVTGWAATGVLLSLALAVGIPFDGATIGAVLAVLVAVGHAAARVVPGREPRPAARETERLPRLAAAGAAVGVAVVLVVLLVRAAAPTGILYVDVWNFWLTKAKSIFYFHGVVTHAGGYTTYENPDYPPFYPATEAVVYHFIGTTDTTRLPLQDTVLGIAFVLAVGGLLRERVRPVLLGPGLLLLVLVPLFEERVGALLADGMLALLFALAGVCGTLWVLERDLRFGALSGVFLAATVLTKNEGLMLGVSLAVALLVASERRRRSSPALALVLAPPLAAVALWRLWIARHGVPPNPSYHLSDLGRPGFLASHVDQLVIGAGGTLKQAVHPAKTLLVIPLAVMASAALAPRRVMLIAPVTAALALAGYSVLYWVSALDVHFYLKAAPRIVTAPVLLCAALLPLLLAETARP